MKRYFFVTLQMDFKRLLYEKVAENSRYYCICSDYYIWVIDMDKCLCGYEIHSRTKWKWLFRRMYVYAYWLIVIWNVAEFCISNIPVYMSLAERRQTIKDWVIFDNMTKRTTRCGFVIISPNWNFNGVLKWFSLATIVLCLPKVLQQCITIYTFSHLGKARKRQNCKCSDY